MSAPVRIEAVDRLDCRIEPFDWAFARERRGDIASHWSALVAAKPRLYDGRVFLMHGWTVAPSEGGKILRGAHFQTDFSAFMAWRDFGFPDPGVRNCFGMAALRAADGAFLLAEMGGHTANSGRVYFPAGTPDPDDARGDRLDIDGNVLRELEEETGLTPGEVRPAPGWLRVDAGPRLGCMKIIDLDAPAREAKREIEARIARQTHAELAGVYIANDAGDIDRARMPDFIVAFLEHMFARG